MSAFRFGGALFALVAISAVLLSLNSCGGSNSASNPSPAGPHAIQHVVIVFQENRTPDNLFHGLANADIATTGVNSQGQTVTLAQIPMGADYEPSNSHTDFVKMYDSGMMDGADKILVICGSGSCPPNPQFSFVNPSDVAPYFQMAQQYTFGDRMFQSNQGPSFPAHQFIISGTSAPTASSNMFASENASNDAGCAAPTNSWVQLVDPSGKEADTLRIFPCFEHQTLTDLLDSAGISWRYYTPVADSKWTGPNAIQHICGAVGDQCQGAGWTKNVVLNSPQVLTDISNGQLASVTWVIPSGQNSDHAPGSSGGPSWVASIVNAIGNSQYWANTAIIVTWDDWGGWYDHVPPPKVINDGTSWGSGYVYGFRVPLIVVSPYAKPAYVSHVNHDFGSILKFVEVTFQLPSLGYADAFADDLSDCFDFNQAPLPFHTIPAPMDAKFFLNDKRVPTPPDND